MNALPRIRWLLGVGSGAAAILLAACASMSGGKAIDVTLSGAEEVPAVATAARGSGKFTVGEDKSVSGGITVTGLSPVAAHIHTGARGQNGPVAVPLQKTGDAGWSVAPGAKFTDAQYEAFKAGNTYVNVHTPANKGGEIRGQLRP